MNKLEMIKELMAMLDDKPTVTDAAQPMTPAQSMIGEYVLVRSRVEGINAGVVKMADETGVVLEGARRLWHHKPAEASASWYEGVSIYGVSDDSRTSLAVSQKVIVEDYSMTLCSPQAGASIRKAPSHEPS